MIGIMDGSNPAPAAPRGEFLRELTAEDLAAAASTPKGSVTSPIAKLRDTHHELARLMASGLKDVEISGMMGYSQSRLSILKRDPTFSGLVEHYRQARDTAYMNLHTRMANLSGDLLTELQERFESDPASFTDSFIHDFFKTLTDRTGFGPRQTNVNINLDLADRLAQARKRAETPPQTLLEIKPNG